MEKIQKSEKKRQCTVLALPAPPDDDDDDDEVKDKNKDEDEDNDFYSFRASSGVINKGLIKVFSQKVFIRLD